VEARKRAERMCIGVFERGFYLRRAKRSGPGQADAWNTWLLLVSVLLNIPVSELIAPSPNLI
jgi:hypothetical protein